MKGFRQFKHAITRTPPKSMADGITTQNEKVSYELALQQYEEYLKALTDLNISITTLSPEEAFPDSHFVEDAAIIHNGVAVMTRPGAIERRGEVDCLLPAIQAELTYKMLSDDADALVDGGDVLTVGNRVLIGLSHRTNEKGADALAARLKEIDPKVEVHVIPFDGVLHLKSGLTALTEDVLLCHPLMQLKTQLPFGDCVKVPEKEAYAANSLVVNGAAMVFQECTETQAIVKGAGLTPLPLDMSEFRKMDGSFTCLSLLW